MRRPQTPRVAGRRLQALARLLRTPAVGRQVAELAMREMLIAPLLKRAPREPELRAIVPYRVRPKPPP